MGLLWRLSIAIMVFVLSLVYALPSVPYLGTALERVLPSSKINLGLDLQGRHPSDARCRRGQGCEQFAGPGGPGFAPRCRRRKIVVLRRVVGGTALEFVLPRAENEPQFRELLVAFRS